MYYSEFAFEVDKNIKDNLLSVDSETRECMTLRLCELSFVADKLCDDICSLRTLGFTVPDALFSLRETLTSGLSACHIPDVYDNISEPVRHTMGNLYASERAILASLLLDKLKQKGNSPSEEDFVGIGEDETTYAYVKNTLSDEAYDVLTEHITDARVRYVPSFAEAVRLLSSGEVGYCLLPIEEKGGLRLPTVENLLYSANLKIRRIVPVFGLDGSAELKYALIARSVCVEPYQSEDDRYLEVRISVRENAPSLSALFQALENYRLELYRIHSVSFEKADVREEFYSIVVKSLGGDFTPLLAYLTLFYETFVVVGIYKNLEY